MPDPPEIDLSDFRRWAMGNLAENRNRGLFAEWLVGTALGVIDPDRPRTEWDLVDLRYRGRLIEVKASGRGQTWKQAKPSTPRFDISQRIRAWDAHADKWWTEDAPRRFAHVYVFCLHRPELATTDNVADPTHWAFWVIATTELDRRLGDQKSIGVATLDNLTTTVSFADLARAVDEAIGFRD